jgi:hypothetical protein
MCEMCDGRSAEDVRRALQDTIDEHGWVMQHVKASASSRPWTYTIGLVERYDHPEVIIVGGTQARAAKIIHEVVERIEYDSELLVAGDTVPLDCACCHLHVGNVHAAHLTSGWFAMWHFVYAVGDKPGPSLRALQLNLCGDPELPFLPMLDREQIHYIADDEFAADERRRAGRPKSPKKRGRPLRR